MRPSFPPVIMLPSFNTHIENIAPSWHFLYNFPIVFLPRGYIAKLPFESPVITSPDCKNPIDVTYLGFSRASKIPIFLYNVPPTSKVQNAKWDFPQVTITFLSKGWNSTAAIGSTEHWNRDANEAEFEISRGIISLPLFPLFYGHVRLSSTPKRILRDLESRLSLRVEIRRLICWMRCKKSNWWSRSCRLRLGYVGRWNSRFWCAVWSWNVDRCCRIDRWLLEVCSDVWLNWKIKNYIRIEEKFTQSVSYMT